MLPSPIEHVIVGKTSVKEMKKKKKKACSEIPPSLKSAPTSRGWFLDRYKIRFLANVI